MAMIPRPAPKQSGVMLLEALIAIFIFSLGILAVVGMQAIAAKQVADAQYRSQASLLADQLFGDMWATDRTVATLESQFDSDNSTALRYLSWKDKVNSTLPGGYTPSVNIDPDGKATVVIQWLAPGENLDTPHKYTVVAKIM